MRFNYKWDQAHFKSESLPHSSIERNNRYWIYWIDVLGVCTADSSHIYLLFYGNTSGGKRAPNDAVTTFTHFTVKRETQRLGHNHSVGCVLVSTSYTDHALHVVEQSHSPMTLKTPYFPPCDWTFPGEFRPGMYSWWRSNCNSCEGKSLSNERRGNAGEALSLTIACSQQFADQNAYSGMHGLVVVVIYGTIWGVCAFHSGLQSSNECSHQAPSLRLVIPGKLWAEFKVRSKAVVHCKKELVVCFNFEKLVSGLP